MVCDQRFWVDYQKLVCYYHSCFIFGGLVFANISKLDAYLPQKQGLAKLKRVGVKKSDIFINKVEWKDAHTIYLSYFILDLKELPFIL